MEASTDVVIVGHPYVSVGMGDQMRSSISAFRAVHVDFKIFDVFRYAARTDSDHRNLIEPIETQQLGRGLRIFHINGNEIEPVIAHLTASGHSFEGGYNVVVPAWELPYYPEPWINLVRKFDEVWAISRFVQDIFSRSNIIAHHVGENIELPVRPFLPRKYFGIRDSAFVLLNFFDLTSFAQRKNPQAVIDTFNRLRRARPYDDVQLVLKVKDGEKEALTWAVSNIEFPSDVLILRKPLSTYETHSLLAACDCTVSLHRSEGFGRGTGEAMFLGRLAMATGWSGNLNYMSSRNSLLVNFSLVPTDPNAYPFAEGQYWAAPDVDHAIYLLKRALDEPSLVRQIASVARRDVVRLSGARTVGLAQAARVNAIMNARNTLPA